MTRAAQPHEPSSSGPRDGSQPPANNSARATAANAHKGGSRRRIRARTTAGAGRSSERAISEPASANITPIDGKTTVSQAQPKQWYATTRTRATDRRRSRYRSRPGFRGAGAAASSDGAPVGAPSPEAGPACGARAPWPERPAWGRGSGAYPGCSGSRAYPGYPGYGSP